MVLRNETDEDLSPTRRAFPRARIIRVSLCNQISRVYNVGDSGSGNESDNPDNLCNNVEGVCRTARLLKSREIAR